MRFLMKTGKGNFFQLFLRLQDMRLTILTFLVACLLLGCVQEPADTSAIEEKIGDLEEKIESVEETVEDVEERVDVLEEEMQELSEAINETAGEVVPEPVPKGKVRFLVTVVNIHNSQTLSPGVFIVHKPIVGITFLGKLAPPELEALAEYGDPEPFREYIGKNTGVVSVYTIDEPIPPGENRSFTVDVSTYMPRENYLSGIQMITGSNDGFAVASNIALFTPGNGQKASITNAQNYDAGTEQNSPLLSGFEGGQPDPSRGEENIDNGIPTSPQQPVMPHPQLTTTVMRVIVTPQ